MPRFRKKPSSSTNPPQRPSSTPPPPTVKNVKKGPATSSPQVKNKGAPAASSSAIPLSTTSPSSDPTDIVPDKPGSAKESAWRSAYGAARMAVDIAKDSSDMLPPLKAVMVALSVLIKNYDQTAANAEQIRDIEKRVQSVGEILTFPVDDQDDEEKKRREALRKKLDEIVAKLEPLSEQHGLLKFLKNVDHANALNGFVQDLTCAVADYQTSLQQSIHGNTKRIDNNTNKISETTNVIGEATNKIGETANRIDGTTNRIDETMKRIDKRTKNMMETADLELLGKLNPVRDAGYQTGHHDTCLPGTRKPVLQNIMRWAEDPQEKHVFWLNGLAGTGKSTITQTFTETVANSGTLGASFFCSRDYADRKELKNIFPTLAYQLACRYPAFRSHIIQTIKQDPSVASRSLVSQLKDLIVDPLSSAGISCVIVVDALDECVDDQPASAFLSVLSRHVKQLSSIKFFITGRPEPRIRAGFRLSLLESSTQIFCLHEIELSNANEDIRLYLREKLTWIAKRSDVDLPAGPWPRDEDLTTLTNKSSGLFIFASTLIKFIGSEYHEPIERLRLILTQSESTAHEGEAGIDALYTQILVHAFLGVKETAVFTNLRRALGAVVLASNPLSRRQIAEILGVKSSQITITLRHLHSVLLIPHEDSGAIRVFHKSFPDFLQDSDRCSNSNFFIDPSTHHGDMTLGCLELLKTLKPNPCDLPDFVMNQDVANLEDLLEDKVGSALRYACAYWHMHIRSSPTADDDASRLITSTTKFFEGNAVPWIEVMSLENRLETAVHGIHNLLHWLGMVNVPTSGLRSVSQDCLRFMMHFFPLIQQSATHIYHSALPLSPERSMFRSMIIRERTRITEFYGRSDAWGALLRTIKPTSGSFICVTTFGCWIAAAGSDRTVNIYDSVTGALRLLLSPRDPVDAMEGSPRGDLLYCMHKYRCSISLWDIQTGAPIHTFDLDWKPEAIAISPEGRYFACAFGRIGGPLKVWEVGTHAKCTLSEALHGIHGLCWLRPEGWLAAAGKESVDIWDLFAGRIHCSFDTSSGVCGGLDICQLAYSQEVDRLAVLHGNCNEPETAVAIVDPQTGASTAILSIRRLLDSIAFSRTTGELICGTKARGLQLLDISTQCWRGLEEFHDEIKSVASLPNGMVAANVEGSGIQLWNLDEAHTLSRQPTASEFTVAAFDKDTIVGTISTGNGCITLLEPTTMSQLCTIPGALSKTASNTTILRASLEQRMVVSAVAIKDRKGYTRSYLELWAFGSESPRWTAGFWGELSTCSISPSGNRLVVLGYCLSVRQEHIWVSNIQNGQLQAGLFIPKDEYALGVEFESEDRFCLLCDDRRIPYVVSSEPESGESSHSLIRQEALPLVERSRRRCYDVDDTREWVVCGSKKICWIPPGYIRKPDFRDPTYCWAGNSLFMAGRDGVLRKFTLSGQS